MNEKFDELTKGLAQCVTRRSALKKFGVGLAAVVLAALGLPDKGQAFGGCKCSQPDYGCPHGSVSCIGYCRRICPRIG